MSIDKAAAARVAKLARIRVETERLESLAEEFNAILEFVDQLKEVDIKNVEPMTSVTPHQLQRREDVVLEGDQQERILLNAPKTREGFFAVPKVIE